MKRRAVFFFCFCVWGWAVPCVALDAKLANRFPYALLTEDYGILNEIDLRKNEKRAFPVPFSPKSISYAYWKCFQTKQVKFLCKKSGDQDRGEPLTQTLIRIDHDGTYDEYETRRAFSLSFCKERIDRWKKLSVGQLYACVAGTYVGREVAPENKKVSGDGWIFDRFKTLSGCDSYFENDCK